MGSGKTVACGAWIGVGKMNDIPIASHQLINQTSGETEYYTPVEIVDSARFLLGGIDLDPASSARANEVVGARQFYTVADNSLYRSWYGRVWLNWPFAAGEKACKPNCQKKTCRPERRGHCIQEDIPGNGEWVNKLVADWNAGNIEAACCICYACTSEHWFAPLLKFPQFFITGRVNYRLPSGKIIEGVTKGSVVTFLPPKEMPHSVAIGALHYAFRDMPGVAK